MGAVVLLAAPAVSSADLGAAVARGDRAFEARGAENDGKGRAGLVQIEEAIAAYEEALVLDPSNLEARWKAIAALYFAGDFAARTPKQEQAFYARGRVLAEAGVKQIQSRLGLSQELSKMTPSEIRTVVPGNLMGDVGRFYFWAAIDWAAWSRAQGFFKIVTEGVAGRLRRYALASQALDPTIYRGGAARLLAHLHANLPRVPLVSGWVDREKAPVFAEQALAVEPEGVGNRVILATVLLEVAPERRGEALGILEEVAASTPRDHLLVEDQATREWARERLAEEGRN